MRGVALHNKQAEEMEVEVLWTGSIADKFAHLKELQKAQLSDVMTNALNRLIKANDTSSAKKAAENQTDAIYRSFP
jgi:hypothetical protein